ncbi:MAG: class I adenylate cyclase [Spirochaetota bacterium]|nr:class I adenylate cyclase [Spirochaetota bacterium]
MAEKEKSDYRDIISKNKQQFQKYNNFRYLKFSNSLSKKSIIDLIEVLPLLITINQRGIPGYVENYSPIGIYGYSPSEKAIQFIKSRFHSIDLTQYSSIKPLIELFAIMGSAGSIAYNEESDIDFWICIYDNKLGQENIKLLSQKLRNIEIWITENYNIETYFFLNDIERVRNDIFDTSEDSFSGKANGKLLKDEFYRSSILLKGKIPFWWVVPSGIDDEKYNKYIQALDSNEFENQYVDFGNLHTIDKGDFLGGGLFQILKSLGNPFKSIIKIGTVERYLLDEENENPLLCNIIKENVHNENLDINHIDPYILMFNQVYDYYLRNIKDPSFSMSTEILKMCFYIKIDPNLSEYRSIDFKKIKSENLLKMIEYVKTWKWTDSKLKQMDNFRNWDITPINKFWNNISKEILKSYKRILKNIENREISKRFTQEDIKFITRKIYSSFSYAENKIRPAVSFKDNPIEKHLTIESISKKDGKINWLLSKGFKSNRSASERVVIHKEPSLISLLTWISMNRMYQKNFTRVEIKSRFHLLDSGFVRELMNDLTLHFSIKRLHIENDYFYKDPIPLLNFIIINLYSKYPKGIEDIYFLYHNSWGETVYEKYENEIDLSQILIKILNGALLNRYDFNMCVQIKSPYPYGSSTAFKRIKSLIEQIYNFFITKEPEHNVEKKYITILGNNYIVYTKRKVQGEEKVLCNIFESELKMFYSLSNNIGLKTIIMVDSKIPEFRYLLKIIESHRENAIQIYYQKERKYCYFYILDEQGAITFYRENSENFIDYFTRLNLFTKNIIKYVVKNNPESTLNNDSKKIELYELKRDSRNVCKISKIDPETEKQIAQHEKMIVQFKVSLNLLKNNDIGYRFSLPYGGETDLFSRSEINNIAKDLRVFMKSVDEYNFYITDVDLSNLNVDFYKNSTSFCYAEKNRFELLMERSLQLLNKGKPR